MCGAGLAGKLAGMNADALRSSPPSWSRGRVCTLATAVARLRSVVRVECQAVELFEQMAAEAPEADMAQAMRQRAAQAHQRGAHAAAKVARLAHRLANRTAHRRDLRGRRPGAARPPRGTAHGTPLGWAAFDEGQPATPGRDRLRRAPSDR